MKIQEIPEWFSKLRGTEKKELLWNFDVADEEKFCNVFMSCADKDIRRTNDEAMQYLIRAATISRM